jgi:hypothetical protein
MSDRHKSRSKPDLWLFRLEMILAAAFYGGFVT